MSTGNLRKLSSQELKSLIIEQIRKQDLVSSEDVQSFSEKALNYYRRLNVIPENEATLAASLKVLCKKESGALKAVGA